MIKKNDKLIELYEKIKFMRYKYKKRLLRNKKIHNATEFIIVSCGTVATTSLFVTLSVANPITLIVGAVFSSISTITKTIKTSLKFEDGLQKLHNCICSLSDLERDIHLIMNEDIDEQFYLDSFNKRLSIIEDSMPAIKINSRSK